MTWTDTLLSFLIVNGVLCVVFLVAEARRPVRRPRALFRLQLASDLANGFAYLSLSNAIALGLASCDRSVWRAMQWLGVADAFAAGQVMRGRSLVLQVIVLIVLTDFLVYWLHRAMHRVPFLWTFHKAHHTVRTEEMYFVVGFGRANFGEHLFYQVALYFPLHLLLAPREAAAISLLTAQFFAVFQHSNLDIGYGTWTRLLVSPRMHHWHHAYQTPDGRVHNFALRLALWDWLFGTAYLPDTNPARLGFAGEEDVPNHFFGHQLYPLLRRKQRRPGV